MCNLCFVYSWENETNQAWSGTPKGLETALARKIELKKINISVPQKGFIKKIIDNVIFPTKVYARAEKVINENFDPNIPYFVFGEYMSKAVAQTFCYQDLSIDFMQRELDNKNSYYGSLPKLIKAVRRYVYRSKRKTAAEFYRNCAGVFTMSEWLKNDLINNTGLPANKVHHVGGGCTVDASLVDFSKKEGNKFLFVGKDWEKKNGDLVVEAFKKLCECHPDLTPQLYVVGPTTPPASVIGNNSIHFLGRLTYSELVDYYNMCDYFVMPSKCDAYGLVFVEALVFGLPCIGKNCYAMPEFISNGENGYLINNDDADELADAMKKLLLNGTELVQKVQKDHRSILEQYSWDSVASRIIDVMEKQGYVFTFKNEFARKSN